MAVTGIWPIKSRLDHVIDYTTNIEKTSNSNYGKELYQELHNFKEYEDCDFNSEEQYLVTGINCSPEIAYEEMITTKKSFNKEKGNLGYHAFQSFKEGEVTPEQAHEIGMKLAEEMWGDRFEVIVSTHINTKHIHNHFVINSVSFKDGKKYYDTRESYAELRNISDAICSEYNLSVLEEKACRNSKINYANYTKKVLHEKTYYATAKKDLDRAIAMAYSYNDFENLLKAMDYELIYRSNKLSIRRSPYKKNIRIERYFGTDYSTNRIIERIEEEQATRIPFIEEYGISKKHFDKRNVDKKKNKGIYGLYLYYCYLLNIFPKKNPYYKIPASIRAEVNKMERISEEIKMLTYNKLETDEQFFSFKREKEKELDNLMDKRSKLWYRHKKSHKKEEKEKILKEIDIINTQIKPLKNEVKMCDEIEMRIPSMKKQLEEVETINRKELEKDELFR